MDIGGGEWNYWNSTTNPSGVPWAPEVGAGIQYFAGDAIYMTNRAPAGVFITLGVIDTRAAERLKTLTFNTPPWRAVTNEATKLFFTFVAIPNRTP